jgi:hypothetical protein
MDVPEIDEYVGSRDWTITCQSARCRFTDYGERTENWVEEMQEAIDEHREWHENGMPQ